jgi:hypothetical protein
MVRRSRSATVVLGLAALAAAAACLTLRSSGPAPAEIHPVWTETKWTFPIDQWGTGKAYRCEASACGTEVIVFLRAKLGFCNCTTGVADDPELERVADLDLFGEQRAALAPGHPIAVRWMKGRSRLYSSSSVPGTGQTTLTIAFNDHCDALVATAIAGHNRPADVEPAVLEFLSGDTVIHWAELALGL